MVRLFPDYELIEQRYYEDTRVYPIMHVIALRKAILERQPWIARNLYNAFEESKQRSLERILDPAVSRYPVPWLTNYAARMQQMFAGDLFPYGIEPNRSTLELFLRYAYEQGIAHCLAKPEDIFPAGIMASVKSLTICPRAWRRLRANIRRGDLVEVDWRPSDCRPSPARSCIQFSFVDRQCRLSGSTAACVSVSS